MNKLLLKLVATNAGWLARFVLKYISIGSASLASWLTAQGIAENHTAAIVAGVVAAAAALIEQGLSWVARKYAVESDLTPIIEAIKYRGSTGLRVVLASFALLSLAACTNDGWFLGLDSKGWTNVLVDGGKALGKQAPGVFLQSYAAEQAKPKTNAKQPVNVQPTSLLLPAVQSETVPEGERAGGWFGSLINLFVD